MWSDEILGRFPKVRTGRLDHGSTGHFENETGFFQEFLMKNDFLRAYYLGFGWSGWITLIKSTILVTKGMSWPVSSYKWKEPLVRPFKWRLYWVAIIHDTTQGSSNTWACGCLQLKWLQCIRDLKIRGRDLTESFFFAYSQKQTPLEAYCFHQKK